MQHLQCFQFLPDLFQFISFYGVRVMDDFVSDACNFALQHVTVFRVLIRDRGAVMLNLVLLAQLEVNVPLVAAVLNGNMMVKMVALLVELVDGQVIAIVMSTCKKRGQGYT